MTRIPESVVDDAAAYLTAQISRLMYIRAVKENLTLFTGNELTYHNEAAREGWRIPVEVGRLIARRLAE